jgi:hypothetical protein
MKNKQTILIVLALAVVASFLTFAVRSNNSMFRSGGMMPLFDGDRSEIAMIEDEMRGGFIPPYYGGDDALDVEDRVYQRSSYHSVVVDDVAVYLRGVKEYILSIDGKVLNSDMSVSDKYESGSLYVKVPVEKFDEATGRIVENIDKVISENINSSDVTGQLVNINDNLQSLKDAKSLKEASIKDAKTEVEKRQYQIEIERLERQIVAAEKATDRVEQKVEYASVSVSAADSERYFNPGSSSDMGYELERAWESLKRSIRVIAYFGVWVLVYSVIWLPVVWVGKKVAGKFEK